MCRVYKMWGRFPAHRTTSCGFRRKHGVCAPRPREMRDRRAKSRSDRVYKPPPAILARRRWPSRPPATNLCVAMAGRRASDNGRPRANDPLMQEVRWRLFRREDIPARLRRLERMEETALREREKHGARREEDETAG